MLNASIFRFTIINLAKKAFWTFMLLQLLAYLPKKQMIVPFVDSFEEKNMETLKALDPLR